MIKIIKHGNPKMKETTCPTCGCVFKYTSDEVITRINGDAWDSLVWDEVKCPECSTPIYL